MISKSVKAKRRRQAAEADRILDILYANARFEDTGLCNNGWPTCHALNVQEGINMLPSTAREIARFPRGSVREDKAWVALSQDSRIVAAVDPLRSLTLLEKAGLL